MKRAIVGICFWGIMSIISGQGLEGIIVEKYHLANKEDVKKDKNKLLKEGAVTYRIYVDMAEGYALQAVFGVTGHPIEFKTTTSFYNPASGGNMMGTQVRTENLENKLVALDSWLTINLATRNHAGIQLKLDPDGSLLKSKPFIEKDGLITGKEPGLIPYNLELDPFDDGSQDSVYSAYDSVLGVYGGVQGPSEENQVLIAQLTTDGELSFEFNVQIASPECGEFERYVAKNPVGAEIQHADLIYGN